MKKPTPAFLCLALLLPFSQLMAQGYQALHGSPYAGSTAVFNNPAASVNSAYKWDFTFLSVQAKTTSNAAYLQTDSLGAKSLTMKEGFSSKFIHTNVDVSLFNILYKIDNRKAINFGLRARTYIHSKSAPFRYSDTISSFNSFLGYNNMAPYLEGFGTHTGWLEADLNYSQVLFENNNSKLSGGITLQIMKGLSGAFIRSSKVSYLESKSATGSSYYFTNGGGSYGYSAGYDTDSFKDLYKTSLTSLGVSFGVEYMTYNSEVYAKNNINYDWKIGASIMDLGSNKYKPGPGSAQFYNPDITLSDADLKQKFTGIDGIEDLTDSLKTFFLNSADITENFSVSNPTRLVINIDKNLGSNFYVNGDMSLNFYSTSSYKKMHSRELNLFTVTPRWEIINWGVYLPIQYNTQGQLWVGAAIKAGPLVLGFHNFGLLKKNTEVNGGGYLLLSFHPFNKKKVLSKMDCPE
jgi:hypothetical protein